MVADALVPAAQRPAGGRLHHGALAVIPGKGADRVQAGEEDYGGEHDLRAVITAQQARAAEASHGSQLAADLGFIVALVVVGRGRRRPATPDPRDHSEPSLTGWSGPRRRQRVRGVPRAGGG